MLEQLQKVLTTDTIDAMDALRTPLKNVVLQQ